MRPWLWAAIPGPARLPGELPAPPSRAGAAPGLGAGTGTAGTPPCPNLSSSFHLQDSSAGFLGERVSPAGINQSLELVPTRLDPPAFKLKRNNHGGDL